MGIEYSAFDGLNKAEISLVKNTVEKYSSINRCQSLGIVMNQNDFSKIDIERMYIIHASYIKTAAKKGGT